MTKEQIQTLIDTNLATGSNITAAEHREVETALLNYFSSAYGNPIAAYGKIGPIDIKASGATTYTCSNGNLISATRNNTTAGNTEFVRVIFPNSVLPDSNFKVRIFVESQEGTTGDNNNNLYVPIWQKVGSGGSSYYNDRFDVILEETITGVGNIYLHVEILPL